MSNKLAELEKKVADAKTRVHHSAASQPEPCTGVAMRLLSDMISGLVIGAILGYNADVFLDTKPLFFVIMVVLGTASGFYNFYKYEMKPRNRGDRDA